MKEGLKIIRLEAENVKKLKAVEITPEDNTVVISGRNEQGKTSVLDSIWLALGGREAAKGLKKPIRDGQEKAHVKLDLGDIIVTRKWTKENTYLSVENKDGAIFKSPQNLLDSMIGNLSFDPLAFSNMSDKEQKETLLDLVELGFNLDEWENNRKLVYDERTDVNRRVKELEGQLAGTPIPGSDIPEEEISMATIAEQVKEAQKVKESNDEKRRLLYAKREELSSKQGKLDETEELIHDLITKLEAAEKKKEEIKSELKSKKAELMELNKTVNSLQDPDMEAFEENMRLMDDTNEKVRQKKQHREIELKLTDIRKKSQDLTDKLLELDEKKESAMKSAKFPIEELGIDDTGVTYKGIPFGQCSAAERLRVSLAMAMALNPKLRVLRITDGSLLDSQNMKIIQDMVKENDYQCWIEVVDESGKMGVYIEDGEVCVTK